MAKAKKWSKHWKSSKKPSKQRKYRYNAPLHIRHKFVSANLSKELRKKYGIRSLPLRKGDTVKIMRGKFKGKKAKVERVDLKKLKVYLEGINITKQSGVKVGLPLDASNLQIVELNLDDKKRLEAVERKRKVKEVKEKAREKTKKREEEKEEAKKKEGKKKSKSKES